MKQNCDRLETALDFARNECIFQLMDSASLTTNRREIMSDMTYTHVMIEAGNGFPLAGEDVIEADDFGGGRLLRVVDSGPILTSQPGRGSTVYLVCEPSPVAWDDLEESEQDRLYSDLHHVGAIAE